MLNGYYINTLFHLNKWQSYPTKNREVKSVKDKIYVFFFSQKGNVLKMNFLQDH